MTDDLIQRLRDLADVCDRECWAYICECSFCEGAKTAREAADQLSTLQRERDDIRDDFASWRDGVGQQIHDLIQRAEAAEAERDQFAQQLREAQEALDLTNRTFLALKMGRVVPEGRAPTDAERAGSDIDPVL